MCLIGNHEGLPKVSELRYTELMSYPHLLQYQECFPEGVFFFSEVSAKGKLRKQTAFSIRRQDLL
jgi:hypothetical protein